MPFLIDDPQVMREIIMDHYKDPIHKETPSDVGNFKSIRMDSDSCIDDITIYLLIEDNLIKNAIFDGIGCAISTASTDILCDMIVGKSVDEAEQLIKEYQNMIYEKEYDEELLGELLAFKHTHKQAARIKCATLGANGIESIIEKK